MNNKLLLGCIISVLILFSCAVRPDSDLDHKRAVSIQAFEGAKGVFVRMDFSKEFLEEYSYRLTASEHIYSRKAENGPVREGIRKSLDTALLQLDANQDSTGVLTYKNMLEKKTVVADVKTGKENITENGPSSVILQGLNENGLLTGGSIESLKTQVMFPAIGGTILEKSSTVPVFYSQNLLGMQADVKGMITLEAAGFVRFKGVDCIRLKSTVHMNEVNFPASASGNILELSVVSEGVHYFDPQRKMFLYSHFILTMNMFFVIKDYSDIVLQSMSSNPEAMKNPLIMSAMLDEIKKNKSLYSYAESRNTSTEDIVIEWNK